MSTPLDPPSDQTSRETVLSRPCLPAVEPLGDRIMMSADAVGAVQPQAVVNPPPQVSQILIGMMKGDTDLFTQDLATLKLAAGADSKLASKLAASLLKIDFAIYKFGQALLQGLPAESKHARAAETIDRQFLKIDEAVARAPADVQLKLAPAVDAIELKVDALVSQLGTVGPAPVLSREDKTTLLKISREWGQMDTAAWKYDLALATNSSKVESRQELLKIKFTDVLISSANVEDATLKAEITNIVATAQQTLIGLQQPTSTGDVISGSGVLGADDSGEADPGNSDPCPACGLAVMPPRSHEFLDLISKPGDTAM